MFYFKTLYSVDLAYQVYYHINVQHEKSKLVTQTIS